MHTPAQHVGEAYKAHISQFKGATMTRLQELLTEVQADTLHLQQRDVENQRLEQQHTFLPARLIFGSFFFLHNFFTLKA